MLGRCSRRDSIRTATAHSKYNLDVAVRSCGPLVEESHSKTSERSKDSKLDEIAPDTQEQENRKKSLSQARRNAAQKENNETREPEIVPYVPQERDIRSPLLRKAQGRTVIVHCSKGPKTVGRLVGFNTDYGQILIETEAHSPDSLVVIQLRYVVRLEVLRGQ